MSEVFNMKAETLTGLNDDNGKTLQKGDLLVYICILNQILGFDIRPVIPSVVEVRTNDEPLEQMIM